MMIMCVMFLYNMWCLCKMCVCVCVLCEFMICVSLLVYVCVVCLSMVCVLVEDVSGNISFGVYGLTLFK